VVSKSFLRVNKAANRLTDYYKRYYQRYQKVGPQTAPPRNTPLRLIMLTQSGVRWPRRKKATIRKINRRVQKIRSDHETERIETAGYEDEMGDDVRDLIESDNNT